MDPAALRAEYNEKRALIEVEASARKEQLQKAYEAAEAKFNQQLDKLSLAESSRAQTGRPSSKYVKKLQLQMVSAMAASDEAFQAITAYDKVHIGLIGALGKEMIQKAQQAKKDAKK